MITFPNPSIPRTSGSNSGDPAAGRPFIDAQSASADTDRICVGDVEMDLGARVVRRAGESIELTGVEFTFLEALLRSAGSVVSRTELSKTVLDRPLTPYDRSLDTHASNLRKKLGHRVGGAERIKTIRGVGYLYAIAGVADGES